MKEVGVIFQGWGVRAILEGRKDLTRRTRGLHLLNKSPANFQYLHMGKSYSFFLAEEAITAIKCPYPKGAMMWVKETWDFRPMPHRVSIVGYRADESTLAVCVPENKNPTIKKGWRSSLFMPRWASRIVLPIIDCYPQRLQEISEEDAFREGCRHHESAVMSRAVGYRNSFLELWESINGTGSWAANPWVWRVQFGRVKK